MTIYTASYTDRYENEVVERFSSLEAACLFMASKDLDPFLWDLEECDLDEAIEDLVPDPELEIGPIYRVDINFDTGETYRDHIRAFLRHPSKVEVSSRTVSNMDVSIRSPICHEDALKGALAHRQAHVHEATAPWTRLRNALIHVCDGHTYHQSEPKARVSGEYQIELGGYDQPLVIKWSRRNGFRISYGIHTKAPWTTKDVEDALSQVRYFIGMEILSPD